MRNWKILCLLTLSSLFRLTSALSQCNITPELTGSSVYDQLGNNNDYIVVCTQGASTGALLVQNDIPSNFLSFFNNYTIDWGDNSADYTTTQDDFTNPAATHLYSIGNYVLTFTATGSNCTVTHTYDVYVGNTPSVSMGTPGGTEGCSEVTIAFPISNADNNIPTTDYVVTFSDGGATQNFNQPPPATVSHTFNQSSCGQTFNSLENSYGVTITATNECGQAQVSVAPVRISDPPEANFTPSAETICNSDVITFDDTSNPGTTANQNGCSSNAKFYWTISPASGWNVASGAMGSNNGLPDNFTIWTPGSDLLGVNFTTPGTYDVTIHYRNGCGPSEHTETICVIEPPTCDFDVNNSSGCGPLTVITDNNTIAPECDGNDLNLNYDWEIIVPGGGSYNITSGSLTSVSPTFNFTNTTTSTLVYTINLTVTPVNPQTGQEMTSCSSTCTQIITVYPAPVISTNPTPNQSICVGGTPGLLTVAYQYGVGTPTYQWYSNTINSNTGGTIINGANATTYQPPTLNNAGNVYYYAVISLGGNCGTISSNPACVSVVADPTISNQPLATQTICSGGTAVSLSMTYANGTGTATYQWYSNTTNATTGGTAIPGATNASFIPNVPTTPGTYYYYGIVTLSGSGCSTATTASAAVQVIADPTVTINTLSYTYCQNATSTPITPTITGGNGTNGYQWYQTGSAVNVGGTAIPGETSSSFSPPTTTVGTQYYYVQVTQSTSGCSSPSQPITVNILPAASFNTQPQPSTLCVGGVPNTLSATFNNGTGTPSYQWYSSPNSNGSNGTAISGATSSNYTPPSNTPGTLYYYVVITFSGGGCSNITSNPAAVTVLADPTPAITQGTSQELCVGGVITTPLNITASGGTGTYGYQWYSNSTSSNSGGTIINGATSASYTPPSYPNSGTYYYYATVSASGNGCDTSPSAVTSVIVVNDPVVTSQPLPAQEICQNAPTTSLTATVTGGSGNATFTWYSSPTNTTTGGTQVSTSNPFTPPSSSVGVTYYYAIVNQSGSGCSVTTATALVTVTPAASFTSQPQGSTVCVDGVATTLSVSITNGLGTPGYQWYSSPNSSGTPSSAISGATNSSYTPPTNLAGNTYYFVEVSFAGGNCSDITSNTALVSVIADPGISLQPVTPQTVCQGNALSSALSFTASGGTGNATYQWYTNTTASSSGGIIISNATTTSYNPPVFNTPGTYYYYATVSSSGNGCETAPTAVVTVIVNTAASASVTGPYSTCGTTAVPIAGTSSGTGSWSASPNNGAFGSSTNINTTFTPNTGTAQDITLIWTTSDPDGSGPCPSVNASTVLTVYPPATASLPAATNLCSNETLPITATTNAPGTWTSTGNGTINPNNAAATIYTPGTTDVTNSPITITWTTNDPDGAGPCASVSASQSVIVSAPPVVNAGPDQTLCLNSPAITLNGTPQGGTWTGNGVNSTGNFNPTTIGTFNLTYTYDDLNECTASDQITINVNQSATADANGPYFICGVSAVNINAITNGTGTWSGGAGSFANAASPSMA
jgi:large repetitive protein